MKQVIIYTDGACRGNPGPEEATTKFDSMEKEIFGGKNDTTNNQWSSWQQLRAWLP